MKKKELEDRVKELEAKLANARQAVMTEVSEAYDNDSLDLCMEQHLGFKADQELSLVNGTTAGGCVLCALRTTQRRVIGDQHVCLLCSETDNGTLTVGEFWKALAAVEEAAFQKANKKANKKGTTK